MEAISGTGYGALMLGLLLEKLQGADAAQFMLTCDETNVASQKTIEKHGGLLEAKIDFEGKLTRRYWIHTWKRSVTILFLRTFVLLNPSFQVYSTSTYVTA